MAEKVSTVLDLPTETFRQTLDQLHDRASSIISLSLQWNDFDQHFASTSNAIKERTKALHSAQESVERKLDDVKNRESRLDEKERAIEGRGRDFEIIQKKENEERTRAAEDIEKSRAELVDKENKLNEKIGEIETIEKELKLKEEQIEEKRKELYVKFKDLEFKERMIQEWAEQVELEKNKCEKLCKQVELKPKQVELEEVNHGFSANIDGKSLQIYLNEHWRVIESMRFVVAMALGHSPDPSMLVLDALQGFYPPHLKKSDNEFDGEIVRSSCSLLLEELMKLSPEICAHVKKEAKRVAFEWVKKLKSDSKHFLEVLCFLQLLACYGLASDFNSDNQLTQFEIVANHSLAPALFRALGLANKVSDFVQNLIKRKKLNAAIKFIYEFGMVGQFQPVSLLNDFLGVSMTDTENLRRKKETLVGQINASKKRLADIKYALRCIEEYKIDFGPEHKSLEQLVGILENEILKRKEAAALGDKIRKLHDEKDQHLAPAVDAPATGSTSGSATSAGATQPQQLSGNKRPRAHVSAEKNVKDKNHASKVYSEKETSERKAKAAVGDKIRKLHDEEEPASAENKLNASHGENQVTVDVSSKNILPSASNKTKSVSVIPSKEELKKLLDMWEKNKSGESEIAAALRSANDPGKLVLDIMNVPIPFMPDGTEDFKVKMLKSSCILLLRQLRAVSPEINPEIRDEAKKIALYWETVLTKSSNKSPLDVICFLQFLASFKLGSVFDGHKLLSLLHWQPDLCKDLGLVDKIPSFIQNRINKEQYIEAVKYIYAFDVVDTFPPVSVLKDYLSSSSKKTRERPLEAQIVDIGKEIKSHEDVIKCIADYKITGLPVEKLKESMAQLEKEKQKLKTRQVSLASPLGSSASSSKGKPKQWNRNKRQRTDYHRNLYNGGKSAMDRHPLQHLPVSHVTYPPPAHHVLPAYPSRDIESNNYGATVTPAYHWDALGNFGPDRPFHY